MRPDGVVVDPPFLDQDLGVFQSVGQLAIEQFVAEPGIEALVISVFPWAAWFDVGGLGPDRRDPVAHFLGDKFRPLSDLV